MEVKQKTRTDAAQFHVGQELCLVNRHDALDRFDLENDLIFDHDIESIATIQSNRLVDDGQGDLPPQGVGRLLQLQAEAFLVYRLK